MMLGARTGAWAKSGGGKPTARDYVSNVAIFDAKENAGFGVFNNSQAFWSDCLHRSRVLSLVGGSPDWRDEYYKLDGVRYFTTSDSVYQDLLNSKVFTIEILVRAFLGRSNGGLLCIGNANRNLWIWERNNTIYPTDPYIDNIQTQFGNFNRPLGMYDMWHSYVFIANGSDFSLYVDGVLFQKIQKMYDISRNNEGMEVGRLRVHGKAGCGYSCLRFSDFAMTDEQRLANYAIDKARFNLP